MMGSLHWVLLGEGSNLMTILLDAIKVWLWLDRLDLDLLVEGPELKTPGPGVERKGGKLSSYYQ